MILQDSNSILTDIGLDTIFRSKTIGGVIWKGVYIEVAYWLPVMDASENMDTDVTEPVGDIIHWNTAPGALVPYYKGVSYSSILGEDGKSRHSNFKIICQNNEIEDIEFNKVALYAVIRDEPGDIVGEPFFFGQVLLDTTRTLVGVGTDEYPSDYFNQIIINFQLAFNQIDEFEPEFYSSEIDLWERVVNNTDTDSIEKQYGLLWDGSVFVGDISYWHTSDGDLVDTKYSITDNTDDDFEGQLALQFVDDIINKPQDDDDLYPHRRRAVFNTTHVCPVDVNDESYVSLELDIYGGCNGDRFYDFYPKRNGDFFLGHAKDFEYLNIDKSNSSNAIDYDKELYSVGTRRWHSLNLYRELGIFNEIPRVSSGDKFYIGGRPVPHNAFGTGEFKFNNASMRIGKHYTQNYHDNIEQYYYLHSNISNDIFRPDNSDDIVQYPLTFRSTQNIYMTTIDSSYLPPNEVDATSDVSGLSMNEIGDLVDIMIKFGVNNGIRPEPLRNSVANDSAMKLVFPVGTNLDSDFIFGPIDTNASGIDTSYELSDYIKSAGSGLDINMVSNGSIWTFGDMKPMMGLLNDLGSETHGMRNLYINELMGNINRIAISFDGNLYPIRDGLNITSMPAEVTDSLGISPSRWEGINADTIGGDGYGYFDELHITTIRPSAIHSVTNNDEAYIPIYEFDSTSDDDADVSGVFIGKTSYDDIDNFHNLVDSTENKGTINGCATFTSKIGYGIAGRNIDIGSCANKVTNGFIRRVIVENLYVEKLFGGTFTYDLFFGIVTDAEDYTPSSPNMLPTHRNLINIMAAFSCSATIDLVVSPLGEISTLKIKFPSKGTIFNLAKRKRIKNSSTQYPLAVSEPLSVLIYDLIKDDVAVSRSTLYNQMFKETSCQFNAKETTRASGSTAPWPGAAGGEYYIRYRRGAYRVFNMGADDTVVSDFLGFNMMVEDKDLDGDNYMVSMASSEMTLIDNT